MLNDEPTVDFTELTWPLSEGVLGRLWQIPKLPPNFLDGLRDPQPSDAKRYLVTATKSHQSNSQTIALAVCTTPTVAGYARVWPPYVPEDTPGGAITILNAVADFSDSDVLAVVDSEDTASRNQFENSRYQQVCRVLHLADVRDNEPDVLSSKTASAPGVSFRPVERERAEEFFALVERTYAETADCPALPVKQSIQEVRLRWDRTSPSEREKAWFTAYVDSPQSGGPVDVGCLVLDLPAQSKHAELVYMGLVPDQRRKGYGKQLTGFAQQIKRAANRNTLTLSVDAENEPALGCYLASGFAHYAESVVFLSKRT